MSSLRSRFLQSLGQAFPTLTEERTGPLVSENLLSETIVDLSPDVLTQAQSFVSAAFTLRGLKTYQDFLFSESQQRGLQDPGNFSVAMSYDFHLRDDGQLQLIEVNTNASFLALSPFLYKAQALPLPVADFGLSRLKLDFLEELRLTGQSAPPNQVFIVDEAPSEQRLYIEFLVYQEAFRSWGWPTEIVDTRQVRKGAQLIYNRDTDFYLEKPEHASLKKNWLENEFCLSPQPLEYLLLADKQRQVEWNQAGFLEKMGLVPEHIQTLRRHIPFACPLTAQNAEELWQRRKSLFFKPLRSYGAKQSYRGSSISKKAFQELIGQEILAQEFISPPEMEVATPQGPQKMKSDLRFYAYQGQVESAVARLYQGQVTNLRTPFGGFACVTFQGSSGQKLPSKSG